MSAQVLVNGIAAGASYAIVAVSFSIICRVARFFHLAHGAVYTIVAYSAMTLFNSSTTGALAVIIAIIISVIVGVSMEVFVYRSLRRRASPPAVLLLASLGLLVCTQNSISLVFGDATQRIYGGFSANSIVLSDAHVSKIQAITIGVSLVLIIALLLWERGTRMGLLLRAVANDPELGTIVGVNSDRVVVVAFILGSALVAVAAILAAFDTDLVPAMGFRAVLMGVVAALVGGLESSLGAFLGGFILGVAQNYAAWVVPTQWQDGLVFSLLILILLVRPTGLMGSPARKASL